MNRKRLVSPAFFQHGALYDAEAASGLPLRLAFEGLWTVADRRGLFEWKPRELKLAVLPYDPIDFGDALCALEEAGFIEQYEVEGRLYGRIPSFARWQTFHKHERPSDVPEPSADRTKPAKRQRLPVASQPLDGSSQPKDVASTPITVTVTGTVTKSISPADADDPRPTNWVARLAAVWCAEVGEVKPGRIGAALKPAVDRHSAERVERAMRAYIASQKRDAKPLNLKWFAEQTQVWIDRTTQPADVIDGEMSDTLELLTRPSSNGVRHG